MVASDSDNPPRGSGDSIPDDDLAEFLGLLNELKSTGCNILVCGDAPRRLFTEASAKMLGADDERRYRALAVTDATSESIAERLPGPAAPPQSFSETTHVLNHAGALRSVTAATNPGTASELAGVKETRIADPQLDGLESALVDAISEFAAQRHDHQPADIRVGVDSLDPLIEFHGRDVVRNCLRTVGAHVHDHDAMAHYVLPARYGSEDVDAFADCVDAVVEIRLADGNEGRIGEQRWHVPGRRLEMEWIPL